MMDGATGLRLPMRCLAEDGSVGGPAGHTTSRDLRGTPRLQDDSQQFERLLSNQLECQRAYIEASIRENHRCFVGQMAEAMGDAFQALSGTLQHELKSGLSAQFEGSFDKLQQQGHRHEELLEKFLQQQRKLAMLGSSGSRANFNTNWANDVSAGKQEGAEKPEVDPKEDPVQMNNSLQLEGMHKQVGEIHKFLRSHPLFASDGAQAQAQLTQRFSNGELAHDRSAVEESHHEGCNLRSSPNSFAASSEAQARFAESSRDPAGSKDSCWRTKTIQSSSEASKHDWPVYGHTKSMIRRMGKEGSLAHLDIASTLLIFLNCIWLGVESEIALEAIKRSEEAPSWLLFVEVGFALAFCTELGTRILLQGADFWRCPNIRMNLFDVAVVGLQITGVIFENYNISWLRALRITRLLNIARIIRGMERIRELRLLLLVLRESMSSIFWVLLLVACMLYVYTLFIMQSVQTHLSNTAAPLDPLLMRYYGSMSSCMLSLFKAITGGAPWQDLLQPLSAISRWFVGAFLFYVVFFILGIMNIVTGIFVSSARVFIQKDGDMRMKDALCRENSPINKLRLMMKEMDKDRNGYLSSEELETHLQDSTFTTNMVHAGMEVWEARGLFQLLDTEALGQIAIDDFLYGIVRLKCKEDAVDLATVMYENKRILTRLLAFMRLTEDNFKTIHAFFGIPSGGRQARGYSHYLSQVESKRKSEMMFVNRGGDVGV